MTQSGQSLPKRRRASSIGTTRGRTLPSGVVTFMFSDIEGSTARWESNSDAMRHALRRHDELLHAAVQRCGGYVFKTVGDEFCTAFHAAHDAVKAAIAIQRDLAAEDFSDVNGIRVRMALHAGRTDERAGDYYGPPVNRVARLLATGHGGQVLLSGAAAELVRDDLPDGATLDDLGWHLLKDLDEPEHVFQLRAPGLDVSFAPLKSLDTGAHNLPQPTTSFVGRERDIADIEALLRTTPLVSIVGVGGVGKTRLALRIANGVVHEYRDGVWFVNLASISDPSLVASTILAALAAARSSSAPALDQLVGHLRGRSLLIVLDNCEHLMPHVAHVAEAILQNAPSVRILATTRESLNIAGEHVYRLQTLDIADATQLFIDRAHAAKADFNLTPESLPMVQDICRRLDGIALATELAAPRLRVLTLPELNARLDERFRVLTGGTRTALPRQKTMHALIDWSYDLLLDEEKVLFRRLSVFSGSFTAEAASEICANDDLDEYLAFDVLTALVDKSLVVADVNGATTRYRLLQSIQDYAAERIHEANECDAVSECHARYYTGFAERAYAEWDVDPAPDWLARASAELDNIRGVLTWTLGENHAPEVGARLIASSYAIFLRLSLLSEAIGWATQALSSPAAISLDVTARIEYGLSMLYNNQLDVDAALASAERAAALYQLSGDARASINASAQLAQQYARQGRTADAQRFGLQALDRARSFDDRRLLALTIQRYASTLESEQIETARALYTEAVALFESLGRDEETGRALVWWAAVEADADNMEGGITLLSRALPLVSGDVKLYALLNITDYSIAQRDVDGAKTYAREALEIGRKQQHLAGVSIAAALTAEAIVGDNPAQAARLLAFARAHFGTHWPPPQYDARRFEALESAIASALSDGERDACEREGATWPMERAIDEAASV